MGLTNILAPKNCFGWEKRILTQKMKHINWILGTRFNGRPRKKKSKKRGNRKEKRGEKKKKEKKILKVKEKKKRKI